MTSTLHAAAEHSRRFLQWWGDELADLVPPAVKHWAAREGRRTVLALEGGRLIQYQEGRGKLTRRGDVASSSPTQAGEEPGDVSPPAETLTPRRPVGLRLPFASCLVRRLDLPAAARRDLAKILALDLERSTPFRAEEVYFDWFLEPAAGGDGTIGVRQVLVKRSLVDPLLQQLGERGIAVDFVDCWDNAGESALPIDLLASSEAAASAGARRFRPAVVLGLAAALLAGSAVMMGLGMYETALELVRSEAEVARAKALAVRRSLGESEAALALLADLRRLKGERPPVIAVLDELTRLLPDEAWVRYLKVEGDEVNVTIVAPRTAELLPLLGGSAMFGAASLAAPVTYDEEGKSERAAVRLRLRPPAKEVGAAAAGGSQG